MKKGPCRPLPLRFATVANADYIDGLEQQQQEAIIDETIEEVLKNGTQATQTKMPLPLIRLAFATGELSKGIPLSINKN
jgi:hypothetical protein